MDLRAAAAFPGVRPAAGDPPAEEVVCPVWVACLFLEPSCFSALKPYISRRRGAPLGTRGGTYMVDRLIRIVVEAAN